MPLLGSCGQLCTMAAPRGQFRPLWDLHMECHMSPRMNKQQTTVLVRQRCRLDAAGKPFMPLQFQK